ncbi:MAG: hypothetical protein IJ735_01465 [Clostridia bacterium]|nr:hypothetical protein [Clostridia bacterium]
MKRYLIVLLLLSVCIIGFAACSQGGGTNVEITTSKAGKVAVNLYDQTLPADKLVPSTQLTPLVRTTDKSITDDATGMHRIIIRTQGEGTLTTSTDKATEGATVTFTATPATNWRFVSVTVNGELLLNNGTSFVMPAQDANVVATFADMRHAVVVGDHIVADWGELRDDYYMSTAYTIVAGQRYEFTVDYQEDNHYYEDKDVLCRSRDGNEILATVTKVGDGRYAFIAPDSDCWVTVTTHEYRHIDAVKVFTSSYDWGISSEQDYTDYFTVEITADGRPYTYGDLITDNAEVCITLSSKLDFTVTGINRGNGYLVQYEKDGSDDQYTFTLDFSAQSLGIEIELSEQPFAVNCPQAEHGNVSCDKAAAFAEDIVVVTVTPDEDYALYTLKYSDGQAEYEIYEQDGVYSFEMPDSDVTITAMFVSNTAIACSIKAYDMSDERYIDLTDAIASLEYAGRSYPVTDGSLLFFDESLIGQTVEIKVSLDSHYYMQKVQYVDGDGNHYGEIGRNEWGDGTISLHLTVQEEDFGIVLRVYA